VSLWFLAALAAQPVPAPEQGWRAAIPEKPQVSREAAIEAMRVLLSAFRQGDGNTVRKMITDAPVLSHNPIKAQELVKIFSRCDQSDILGTFEYNRSAGQVVRLAIECVNYDFSSIRVTEEGEAPVNERPVGIDFWFDGTAFEIVRPAGIFSNVELR
jgi:hypothetical protein